MKIKDVDPNSRIANGTTLYVDVLEKLKTHKSSCSRGKSVKRTKYRIGDDTGHIIFLASNNEVVSAKSRVKICDLEVRIKDNKVILMGTIEVTGMPADYHVKMSNDMSADGFYFQTGVEE